jgi:hypothetical protein
MLTDERFERVMGECDIEAIGESSILKITCETTTLVRMLPTFDLDWNVTRR